MDTTNFFQRRGDLSDQSNNDAYQNDFIKEVRQATTFPIHLKMFSKKS